MWTNALRSGKFTQGRGTLRKAINGDERFCVLGVLADLYVIEHDNVEWNITTEIWGDDSEHTHYFLQGYSGALAANVTKWAGLRTSGGAFGHTCLYRLNDELHSSFAALADLIESEPEGLFEDK